MTDSDTVIGIDFISTDSDGGLYGLYESTDGGEEWMPLLESRNICDLLDYAKARYGNDTPMVMQQHIQDILLVQIIEEATAQKLKHQKNLPKKSRESWLMKILNIFRKQR